MQKNQIGAVGSSQFASVTFGNGEFLMGQSVTVRFRREVRTVPEIGSTTVYFVPGIESGSMDASKLAGKGSSIKDIWDLGGCGSISGISFDIGKGKCSTDSAEATWSFEQGILQEIGFTISAQSADVTESCNVLLTGLT